MRGKAIILIDDGLATGAGMRRRRCPASTTSRPNRRRRADRRALDMRRAWGRGGRNRLRPHPEPFRAVGLWYEDFTQTTDEEVRDLLRQAEKVVIPPASPHRPRRDEPAWRARKSMGRSGERER